jgi:hypothetical protein
MPPLEQYELSQNIPRVFAAATRRGAAFDLEYWGPTQLVMSLEVAKFVILSLLLSSISRMTDTLPSQTLRQSHPR